MYRNQSKNFFYDISISTPDGKKSVRLTDTLLKLCDKVDIMEAVATEESDGASSLTISFIEADFLPDDLDKTPTEGISGRGYLTNRTGALIDLRFDSEKGFTYVTPEELQSGLTQSSRSKSNQSEVVKFLFSTNNYIEVTWGNLEPKVSRTRKFQIGTVNYSTGAGGNNLSLQCYTLQKDLARIKVDEGITFVDNTGRPQSLKQCVQAIAYVFGARLEFDGEEVGSKPPTYNGAYLLDRTAIGGDTKVSTDGSPAYLLRSQSIDFWLRDLARKFNSTYEVFEDPLIAGIPVIKFTANTIRWKKVVRTLNYRDPAGIMLEFQFNTIAGEVAKESSASAVDEDGEAQSDYVAARLTDGRAVTTPAKTFDGIPYVYQDRADKTLQRTLVGSSVTTPSTTVSSVTNQAQNSTIMNSFMGFITVKTIGHPDFQPDVMNIQGVGVRASTTYRFFQVQHSLSTAGYICTMQGKTQESVEQGLNNGDELKENMDYITTQLATGTDSGLQ